jgi:hypothetical protein
MTWPPCASGQVRPGLRPCWSAGQAAVVGGRGTANTQIGERLGVSRPTVIAWRKRYAREGLTGGLADRSRRGRPQTVRHRAGVSHSTVARVWAEYEVKPWQVETFKFFTDPQLDAKVRDVVGLYLDPPAHAVVLGLFPHNSRSRSCSGR